VAARSIGGLCARTLRFGLGDYRRRPASEEPGGAASLEEIVVRNALGRDLPPLDRAGAAGVMMLPIPSGGMLAAVRGVDEARAVPLVEDVQVTAKVGEVVVPLPEGAAYLGFMFARGETPDAVEQALRTAHARLAFDITPLLPKV
jgi:hypothetical protein